MSKIHTRIEHQFVWMFQISFTSKRLRNIKSTLQQLNEIDNFAKIWKIARNTQSTRSCIDLHVSQLFCIEKIMRVRENRPIKCSELHTMRKRQIREVCNSVCWFKQSSKNFSAKTRKCDENIHTNQICFRFDISTLFAHEEFSCSETNSSFSLESILKSSEINRKYTYKWVMFLPLHFRILQSSWISSSSNRTIVDKLASFWRFLLRNRTN